MICTVLNESDSIIDLVESVLHGDLEPDEIIIVDGGSTDRTPELLIEKYQGDSRVKVLSEPGARIARGRNIAIQHATGDLIASIDAGCRADRGWLKELIRCFEAHPESQVVGGFYLPDSKTPFELAQGLILFPNLSTVDKKNFLPSGRSILLTKKAWKSVGGYPEDLRYGEDTAFDIMLRERGCALSQTFEAIVYWRPRPSPRALFLQYRNYSEWNVRGDNKKLVFGEAYGRSAIGYLLDQIIYALSLGISTKNIRLLANIPLVVTIVFFAKISGIIRGSVSSKFSEKSDSKSINSREVVP